MASRPRPPKPYDSKDATTAAASGALPASSASAAASRLKPWEREAAANSSSASSSLIRQAATGTSTVDGGLDSPRSSAAPPLPSSSSASISRSRYGTSNYYDDRNDYGYGGGAYGSGDSYRSYGSSYGGYGGYGAGSSYGSYGGYGGGYSPYRSRYGAGDMYGGGYDPYNDYYGKYGGYDRPGMGRFGPLRALDQGFHWMHDLQSVTDGFGRFASILDSNSQAMHGMLSSIVRLIENVGLLSKEVGMFVSGFALIRVLSRFFGRLFGRKQPEVTPGTPGALDVAEFSGDAGADLAKKGSAAAASSRRGASWSAFLATMAVLFLGIPALVALFRRASSAVKTVELEEALHRAGGRPVARCLYAYTPQTEQELPISAGDLIIVWNELTPEWWEGESVARPGQIGLFPANYVRVEHPGNARVTEIEDSPYPEPRRRPDMAGTRAAAAGRNW